MEEEQLRAVFEARDVDGDGLLSFQDLQQSTNLSESELQAVFEACQSGGVRREFLTFEEFAAGFRRFPKETEASRGKKLEICIESAEEKTQLEGNALAECFGDVSETLLQSEADIGTDPDLILQGIAAVIAEKSLEKGLPATVSGKVVHVLSAASEHISMQRREIGKLQRLLAEECSWNEAICREHAALKRTCKLLTDRTREFEAECLRASAASETQAASLRQQIESLRSEQLTTAQRLEDVHNLLQDKETQAAELKSQLRKRELEASLNRFLSKEQNLEAAPSPQVPKTSRAALRFLFSPRKSPEDACGFQESLRKRRMALIAAREKELQEKEETLRLRELQVEAAVVRKCEALRAENEELRTQLLRERIQCESYKTLARESPMESLFSTLHDELEKVREASPVRVRITPQSPAKPKRSCWFFL